jgi:hypothetical protein
VRGIAIRTVGLVALVSLGLAEPAQGAEETRVVSGRLPAREWMDWTFSLNYLHEKEHSPINREVESQTTGGGVDQVKDLIYRHSRDVMQVRGEAGIIKDLSLFMVMSFVVSDQRSLDFDRTGDCIATPDRCVNETNSTTLRDGILPGYGQPTFGFDARSATASASFQHPSGTVFRGPSRSGFEYLGLGVSWAALDQARDDTKPTWILRLETRFSLGDAMRFDRAAPTKNAAVGLGYHQFILSTLFSRRFGPLEPYVGSSVMLPWIAGGSPYSAPGTSGGVQKRFGFLAGVEATLWQDPLARSRVVYELRGQGELRLAGLAQSPLWEALSGDSRCPKDPSTCRNGVDLDLNKDGIVDHANPGVTPSPSYSLLGGDTGFTIQIAAHTRLRGLFGLFYQQAHNLTDTSSGNAMYDVPGRRYRVEGGYLWRLFVDAGVVF